MLDDVLVYTMYFVQDTLVLPTLHSHNPHMPKSACCESESSNISTAVRTAVCHSLNVKCNKTMTSDIYGTIGLAVNSANVLTTNA